MQQEKDSEYILGADDIELQRLGVQHQIWAEEMLKGWRLAGFSPGQTILDLGCGPGYCSQELAFITGLNGNVIAVDQSTFFIEHVRKLVELHHLKIMPVLSNFNDLIIDSNSLDGMYCRWALAWIPNPDEILANVYKWLKPGGKIVIHEYYDWKTHQTFPKKHYLDIAIKAAYNSFNSSEGKIDIGRDIPGILSHLGMRVESIRPMAKVARPKDANWYWPKSFYQSYFPRLVKQGALTQHEMENAFLEVEELENDPGTTLFCPMMSETIAVKL